MGSLDQVHDADALLGNSDALLAETRRLLDEARAYLRSDATPAPDTTTIVATPVPSEGRQRKAPLRLVGTVMAGTGLVLFGVAAVALVRQPAQHSSQVRTFAAQPKAVPVTSPGNIGASEAPPPPPPLWVSIPRLGARAAVDGEVQVIPDGPEKGLLSAPPDYHDLGWFRQFGGVGVLVLDGHVGYRSDPGPLAFIGSLRAGDKVVVGNQSSQLTYRVAVVATALKGHLPAEYFAPAYSKDVMLITCDYTSPFSNGHFADNVYVVAQPEN